MHNEITNEQLCDTENKINEYEKRVHEMMEKAFWDLMRDELNQTPPESKRITPILEEIKEKLKLIIPNNESLKTKIDEIIDIPHIQLMYREGVMNFNAIVDLTTKIALFLKLISAPAMDNEIDTFAGCISPKFIACSDFVEFFQWYLPLLHLYIDSIEQATQAIKIQNITDNFSRSRDSNTL